MRSIHLLTGAWLPFVLITCIGALPLQSLHSTPAAPAAVETAAPSTAPQAEPARLETASGVIHGTLLAPAGAGPHPVALLIAGSGPTDRDGNSRALPGKNNSLRYLAEGLAARGIASLRYDKRGIEESAAAGSREEHARFDHMVDDAAAWARQLRADRRFSTVTLVGHSEGSLIGMLAARAAAADGYVSVAGIARRASEVLRDQVRPQLTAELAADNERILRRLESGELAEPVPPALAMLYRPSVQPYLISWMRYQPTEELARLSMPVLIVQGTTDLQVGVAEAEALKRARPAAKLVVIEGMNHVLKEAEGQLAQQLPSYSDPSLPVVPRLVEALGRFILGLRKG